MSGSAATRHRPRCPAAAGRRRTAAAVAARRQGSRISFCSSALVKWPGRRGQRRMAVRICGHRRGQPDTGSPHAPALRTPATAAGQGQCGSGQAGQPAAGPSTTRQPCPTGTDSNVRHRPARPADRQIRSLVLCVDLVGSRWILPAHVGWLVDPDGSRRDRRSPGRALGRGGAHLPSFHPCLTAIQPVGLPGTAPASCGPRRPRSRCRAGPPPHTDCSRGLGTPRVGR
jgi:hypothetical protein